MSTRLKPRPPRPGAAESPVAATRPRRLHIALGLLTALLGALGVVIGYVAPDGLPLQDHYTLEAELRDAANISPHNPVRMGGRRIGQVLEPRIEDGQAVVELQLDPSVAPLRSDSRVVPRARSVLGQTFLEIVPGRRGRPLAGGELLPLRQSESIVELDEMLSTFDAATRRRTVQLLDQLGGSSAGRGVQLNETLAELPAVTTQLRDLAEAVNNRGVPLTRLTTGADAFVGALDPVREDLAGSIEHGSRVFGALADERRGLRDTLREAPPALHSISSELPAADTMLAELRQLAAAAQPTLAVAPSALRQTSALLREGRRGVRLLERPLRLTGRALPPTQALLAELRPSLEPSSRALLRGRRLIDAFGERPCDLRRFLLTHGGPEGAFTFRNDAGGVLRYRLVANSAELLAGAGDAGRQSFGNAYPRPCEAGTERLP